MFRSVRWRRRSDLPDEARAGLRLERGERVLSASRLADGRWVAATQRALVSDRARVEWVDVGHAQWLDEERTLLVEPVRGAFETQRLGLPDPGRLPETVRERVVASIVVTRKLTVPGAGGVRVVGRRHPDGHLLWQVVPDAGVADDDPAVRSAAAAMIGRLRAELGEWGAAGAG